MPDHSDRFDQPENQPPDSKFQLKRRMPGWRPDTKNGGNQKLYPEEMLLKENEKFAAFRHPKENKSILTEPDPMAPAAEWHEFNSWIVGSPLKTGSSKEFDMFLNSLARFVRRYNAALYWMRRLHFHENATAMPEQEFPRNSHGDQDNGEDLPDKGTQKFRDWVADAEKAWKVRIDELNYLLAGKLGDSFDFGFIDTKADMIEVNGYIVSMRVVAQEKPWTAKDVGIKQIGGSSSSHVSINAAFSSSRL